MDDLNRTQFINELYEKIKDVTKLSKCRIKKYYNNEITLFILNENQKNFVNDFCLLFDIDKKKLLDYYTYGIISYIRTNKKKSKVVKKKEIPFEKTKVFDFLKKNNDPFIIKDIYINGKKYEIHDATKLVFEDNIVIGKFKKDKIEDLEKTDIYTCKEYNFLYKIPFNLGLNIQDDEYEKELQEMLRKINEIEQTEENVGVDTEEIVEDD